MTGEAPVLRFHDGPSFAAADTCNVLVLSWGPFENCLEANCPSTRMGCCSAVSWHLQDFALFFNTFL